MKVENSGHSPKHHPVDAQFLLGAAGTGKTHRCLEEVRAELTARPEGEPLIFLAPKQATFQIERQLLADARLAGFSRLHILSFPRLAHFLHETLGEPEPRLLDETGRVMVLRALLRRHQEALTVFRRSASRAGFAGELSRQLREFQEQGVSPTDLEAAAQQVGIPGTLAAKLRDTARLARAYASWLRSQRLTDADALLDAAAEGLAAARRSGRAPRIGAVWLDGFAEMTPQELRLLTEVVAAGQQATLAFCLEEMPPDLPEPLSPWSGIGDTFRRAHARLSVQPGVRVTVSHLSRDPQRSRFSSRPFLAHVEAAWHRPRLPQSSVRSGSLTTPPTSPREGSAAKSAETQLEMALDGSPPASPMDTSCLELMAADSLEAEALLAAREVQQHVDRGGRYRDCAILLRSLESHGDVFRRTWRRLEMPLFLDRREPVGNDPLTTLTRCALRLGPGGWLHEDWFGALRSGLAGMELEAVDRLENDALAKGWAGGYWSDAGEKNELPRDHQKIVEPFARFVSAIEGTPTGGQMVLALTNLWEQLDVAATFERWDGNTRGAGLGHHLAVHRQLEVWLKEIQRALGETSMSTMEWLDVFESAWVGLTVGLVPPALDQVLVGAIDRSRNPNLEVVILPGWNEGLFPPVASSAGLLTASERQWLQSGSGNTALRLPQVVIAARESFLAYIGLTRASQRVAVTWVEAPAPAAPRSPFIGRLERLGVEPFGGKNPARAVDLWQSCPAGPTPPPEPIAGSEQLSPALAEALYGPTVLLSASRLERMAACPHQSFLRDTLRIREREILQFEALEQGDLLHQVLAEYHRMGQLEGGSWADPDAEAVAARLQAAAQTVLHRTAASANPRRDFAELQLTLRLLDFVRHAAAWMPDYGFLPESAELAFGTRASSNLPPLELVLPDGKRIVIEGKIDRVDRGLQPPEAAIVLDYKSRERKWDQAAVDAGLELQLPIYALALQAAGLPVGGAAYASLKDRVSALKSRADVATPRETPFPHRGRFSAGLIGPPGNVGALPFRWKFNANGAPSKQGDLRTPEEFAQLLTGAWERVHQLGSALFAGNVNAQPNPAARQLPCDWCEVRASCRRS